MNNMGYDEFLEIGGSQSKDAKWNLFKYQDHLTQWISISAEYLHTKDYPSSFEAMTIIYTDAYGFFSEKEREVIDTIFNAAMKSNTAYQTYIITYSTTPQRENKYNPPMQIYFDLINFRKQLMVYLTEHELLIPRVKKGDAGAGGQ